ncbi:MAG: hypothetical protein ACKVS9_06840 [Phycisphaerae bacterium]
MNSKAVGLSILAIVVFGLAGWRILAGSGELKMSKTFTAQGICLSCKTEGTVEYAAKTVPPYKCASCDAESFYSFWYCMDCQYRFVPDLMKDAPRRPVPYPVCLHCNCKTVSAWIPELMPQRGDAKLPKYP